MRESLPLTGIDAPRRVGTVSVAHGINEFYAIVLPPLFPFLVTDLSISYAQAGTLLTVFYAMYVTLQVPAGLLADRVGKFRMVVGGVVVLGGSVVLMAFAPDYRTLLAVQVLAGAAGSTYHPAGMSLVSDLESAGTEGRAMGIHGAIGTVGVAAAPALLGALTTVVDWRTALAVAGVTGLAAVAVLWVVYRSGGEIGTDRPAPAADQAADRETSDRSIVEALRARARAAVAVPVTDYLIVLLIVSVLVATLTRAIQTYTTSFVFAGGTGAAGANGAFVALLVGSGIASLSVGDLADRVDRNRLGVGIAGGTAVLLGATRLLPDGTPYLLLLGWFFAVGVVSYGVSPVKNALSSGYAERETSGGVFGLLMTASAVGSTVSPTLFGVLAERFGLAVAYPAIGVVCLLLAGCYALLGAIGEPTTLWDPGVDPGPRDDDAGDTSTD